MDAMLKLAKGLPVEEWSERDAKHNFCYDLFCPECWQGLVMLEMGVQWGAIGADRYGCRSEQHNTSIIQLTSENSSKAMPDLYDWYMSHKNLWVSKLEE